MTKSNLQEKKIPSGVKFLMIALGLLLVLFFAIGMPPIAGDPEIAEKDWEAEAAGSAELPRDWPNIDTDIDPELANLGYQLFFDPILSADNDLSCAHCHHPDKGFGDGLTVTQNAAGEKLNRHSSSLWNIVYVPSLFWDGRVDTLEEQTRIPLLAANEMNQNPEELIVELEAIDVYVAAFDALFDDGVTFDNLTTAIAEFERTLISNGSAFDAYAEGDLDAMSAQQLRGLAIFRSDTTRCIGCHIAPAFTDQSFRVVGVPDNGSNDKGRGDITPGLEYAFKVPTLRNAVLSAPYMHNGEIVIIEDVVDFYGKDAQKFEQSQVDFQVEMGFNLTEDERNDLVSFLYALVDETIPEEYWEGLNYIDAEGHILIPDSVPSGSDFVVKAFDNPTRVGGGTQ